MIRRKEKPVDLISETHRYSAWETAPALDAYLRYVAAALEADRVIWFPTYRGEFGRRSERTELLGDWQILDFVVQGSRWRKSEASETSQIYCEAALSNGGLDPYTKKKLQDAGKTRVYRGEPAASPGDFDGLWSDRDYIGDRMTGVATLDDNAESYLLVDRLKGHGFSLAEEAQLLAALVDFPRLHHWLFLERGLIPPAARPFSPREREVISLLLQSLSEKEIAASMGLSISTVHGYILDIYKNLDVNSRGAFTRLWLERIPD